MIIKYFVLWIFTCISDIIDKIEKYLNQHESYDPKKDKTRYLI